MLRIKNIRNSNSNSKKLLQSLNKQSKNTRTSLKKIAGNKKNPATSLSKNGKLAQTSFRTCKNGVCGGPCSFDGDTLVKTIDGYKPIKTLQAGHDFVWAKDEFTGDTDWKPVLASFSNHYDETVKVTYKSNSSEGRQSIASNRKHPFFVKTQTGELKENKPVSVQGSWVQAHSLSVGDFLLSPTGGLLEVESIDVIDQPLQAYNVTIQDFNTYFVGSSQLDNTDISAWVHNDCHDKPRKLVSRIKESSRLVKEAEKTGKSHQDSINKLVKQLQSGNLNPGRGTKPIGKGLSEARARDGARVYFRVKGDNVEILGKSSKANQKVVLKEVLDKFGREKK